MYMVPMCNKSNEIPMAPSNELPQHIPTEVYGGFQLFARGKYLGNSQAHKPLRMLLATSYSHMTLVQY